MPTRRTRTAKPGRPAIVVSGRHEPVGRAAIDNAVAVVLAGERRQIPISISFVGPATIRRLNASWLGHDRVTDVIAFTLATSDRSPVGDLYVCRAVARRQAAQAKVGFRHELLRLVIHGTLHVLGYDHPEGDARTRSPMWRKQERYLACVV